MPDEAVNKNPVVLRRPEVSPTRHDEISEDDAVQVTPFQTIHRGEDTVDDDDRVTFADFRPQVLPADAEDEVEVETVPKDESAPELASSAESARTTEPKMSEPSAPEPATEDAGKPSPSEPSKQPSSTKTKTGSGKQPA